MSTIAYQASRARPVPAHHVRPANLVLAILAGAAAAMGMLFGVSVEDLNTRA